MNKISITACTFVLDEEKATNIRKNGEKKLKLLVLKNDLSLPSILYSDKTNIKDGIRAHLESITGNSIFHLEQVYTLDTCKYGTPGVSIIYIAIMNRRNITQLNSNYTLIDFSLKDNHILTLEGISYEYRTITKIQNHNVEYIHQIENIDDFQPLYSNLLTILISYKFLRTRIFDTDIIFKFFGEQFTLDEVHQLYEKITDSTTDKSNYRKKILKYCEKTEYILQNKGYRPTQYYRFVPMDTDIWL